MCTHGHLHTPRELGGAAAVAAVQKLAVWERSSSFSRFTYITQLFAVDGCLLLNWRVGHLGKFGLIRVLFVGVLEGDNKYMTRKSSISPSSVALLGRVRREGTRQRSTVRHNAPPVPFQHNQRANKSLELLM